VAEYPDLPIAVHCDHGDTLELIQQCINDGYTSVMIDGSHHPYDQNVKITADAVKMAHAAGVVVEAELGMLGGIEEDVVGMDAHEYEKNVEKFLTDPVQAKDFWEKTKCDSLAVAIGTSHGAFKFKHEAKLAFDRIEQIMKTCPGLPLVMHGSSSVPQEFIDLVNKYGGNMPNAKGVPEDQIAMAVQKYGVCKVNIDTDLRLAMTAKIREVFATKAAEFDPRNYLGPRARRSPRWSSGSCTSSTAPARPTRSSSTGKSSASRCRSSTRRGRRRKPPLRILSNPIAGGSSFEPPAVVCIMR
jgi:fructose-bisphosphate aldolase class II